MWFTVLAIVAYCTNIICNTELSLVAPDLVPGPRADRRRQAYETEDVLCPSSCRKLGAIRDFRTCQGLARLCRSRLSALFESSGGRVRKQGCRGRCEGAR